MNGSKDSSANILNEFTKFMSQEGAKTLDLNKFKEIYGGYKERGLDVNFAIIGTQSTDDSLLIQLLAHPNEHTLSIIKYLVEEEGLDIAKVLSSRNLNFNPQTKVPEAKVLGYAREILDYLDEKLPTAAEKNKTELLPLAIYFGHFELFNKLLNNQEIDIGIEGLRGDTPLILLGHHTDRAPLLDAFIAHERFNAKVFESLVDNPWRAIASLGQYGSDQAWNTMLKKLKSHPKFNEIMTSGLERMNFKEIDSQTKEGDKEWLGRMPDRVMQVFQESAIDSLALLKNPVGTLTLFMNAGSDSLLSRLKLDLLIINDPRVIEVFNESLKKSLEGDEEGKAAASKKFGFGKEAVELAYLKIINQHDDIDYKKIANNTHLEFFKFLQNPNDLEIKKLAKNLDVKNIEGFCAKLENLTGNDPSYTTGISQMREQLLEKVRSKSVFELILDFVDNIINGNLFKDNSTEAILSSDPMDMARFMDKNSLFLVEEVNKLASDPTLDVNIEKVKVHAREPVKASGIGMNLTPLEISPEGFERLGRLSSTAPVTGQPTGLPGIDAANQALERARKHTDKLKAAEEEQKKNPHQWQDKVNEGRDTGASKGK